MRPENHSLKGYEGHTDFNGVPTYEKPPARPYFLEGLREVGLPELLPTYAHAKGYRLVSLEPSWGGGIDPYVILDQWGHIAHQWPDDFIPDMTDVFNKCKELNLI